MWLYIVMFLTSGIRPSGPVFVSGAPMGPKTVRITRGDAPKSEGMVSPILRDTNFLSRP